MVRDFPRLSATEFSYKHVVPKRHNISCLIFMMINIIFNVFICMKFLDFYTDIISEARYSSDEKFDWIASKMESWLFDKMVSAPYLMKGMKWAPKFREYIKNNTREPFETDSNLVMALDHIEDFLQSLSKRDSQDVIKDIMISFPEIRAKISRFGKPEVAGKKGRPAGSKNSPKIDKGLDIDVSLSTPKISEPEISIDPSPVTPKRAGRPKMYNDDFTAMERSKYKKEGPAMIKSLEAKVESLDNEVNMTIARIRKIMADIDKRKKFFGIE